MSNQIYSGSNFYQFNNKGEIYGPYVKPSGEWLLLGAVRYNNFGTQVVERCPFKEIKKLNGQWKYKNGKQKWYIQDLDHGTKRTWMSPDHEILADRS